MDKIALIGLGNTLLRDDGIGVHVLHILEKKYHFTPGIQMVDGGTLGLDLLPVLESQDKILFIDAVDFGRESGYIGEMEGSEIPSILRTRLSVHHIGLSDLLLAAKWMDIKPKEICVVGIQPESLETGMEMTELMESRIRDLIARIFDKLNAWGVTCVLQFP